VRVTVIATGFRDDNVAVSTPSITPDRRASNGRQDRRAGRPMSNGRGSSSDAFDIPDFLKRSTRM
jgi:hypothetical protein